MKRYWQPSTTSLAVVNQARWRSSFCGFGVGFCGACVVPKREVNNCVSRGDGAASILEAYTFVLWRLSAKGAKVQRLRRAEKGSSRRKVSSVQLFHRTLPDLECHAALAAAATAEAGYSADSPVCRCLRDASVHFDGIGGEQSLAHLACAARRAAFVRDIRRILRVCVFARRTLGLPGQ